MKKTIKIVGKIILGAAAAGVLFFFLYNPLQYLLRQIQDQVLPCGQPIAYSLGSFDERFGISQKDFLAAVSAAKQIWEKPVARELFKYTADGKLKINLIYDNRQEATDKMEKLGLTVKDDRASYDAVKARYQTLNAQYLQEKTALTAKIAEFNSQKSKYEATIGRGNGRGGVSPETYAELEAQRLALNAEADAINKMKADLNAKINDLNALAIVLNKLAAALNITTDKYNLIGRQLPGEFEEGTYQSGPDGGEINIYQFNDQAMLIRLLAHELGHALGLDHLENSKAIMHRLNNGINTELTADDLAELKKKCNIQ